MTEPDSAPLHSRIAAEIIVEAVAPGRENLPLPSEHEVQRRYGVSYATACRAFAELREAGAIVTIPGQGIFRVLPPNTPHTTD